MKTYSLAFAIWLGVGTCKRHWHCKIFMNTYFMRLYVYSHQTVPVKQTHAWNSYVKKRLIVSSYTITNNNSYACVSNMYYTTMFKRMRDAKSLNE